MTFVNTLLFAMTIGAPALLLGSSIEAADARAARGRALLTHHCAACHAIGHTGESPLRAAPPFRKIGDRLDMNELMQRMQEGLVSAHKDMPAFRFTRADAHAVRSYLNSIQE